MDKMIYGILWILVSYLIGGINPALIMGKIKKVDLRSEGSKNPGTSNAVLTMGWGVGVLVGVLDIGKGVLCVIIARLIAPELVWLWAASGAACVLGHIYPCFLKFKGGKGFAAYVGLMLALNWKFGLIMLVVVAVLLVVSDYIVVSTVANVIALPIFLWITEGWLVGCIVSVVSIIILVLHKKNYIRIYKGTEVGLRSSFK